LLWKGRDHRTPAETIQLSSYLKDKEIVHWRYSEQFHNGTLLHVSAYLNDYSAACVLLISGADVNVVDCKGDLPINLTSDYGITRLLLKKKSPLNHSGSIGTPLHAAIALKKYSTIRHLLKKGARTDIVGGVVSITADEQLKESNDRRIIELCEKYQHDYHNNRRH